VRITKMPPKPHLWGQGAEMTVTKAPWRSTAP